MEPSFDVIDFSRMLKTTAKSLEQQQRDANQLLRVILGDEKNEKDVVHTDSIGQHDSGCDDASDGGNLGIELISDAEFQDKPVPPTTPNDSDTGNSNDIRTGENVEMEDENYWEIEIVRLHNAWKAAER